MKKIFVGKIFVGGGSDERDAVAACIYALRTAGWEITFDWPKAMESEPEIKSVEFQIDLAVKLENALVAADVCWIMLPRNKSEGAAAELGFFRGLLVSNPKPHRGLVVSGDAASLGRIYPYRALVRGAMFREHEDALAYLVSGLDGLIRQLL